MCASWDDVAIRANWVPLIRRLLARTFHVDQNVIVKATSFVSDIGLDLIAPSSRTAFLFTSLSSYMKTILAGENSRRELDKAHFGAYFETSSPARRNAVPSLFS